MNLNHNFILSLPLIKMFSIKLNILQIKFNKSFSENDAFYKKNYTHLDKQPGCKECKSSILTVEAIIISVESEVIQIKKSEK